jgi:vacuolar-type H+-ATPase subunit E/Vma4
MALAELLRVLEDDAAGEVRAIAEAAAGEAARIDAEASARRSVRLASATAGFAAKHRAAGDAEIAVANRAARADILAARAGMLERVRAGVSEQLPDVLAGDPVLARVLVAAALACVGEESGTLRCTPVLADIAREASPAAIRVEAEPDIATGLVIELATGTRIDATLTTLLDRVWPSLACEALRQERAR